MRDIAVNFEMFAIFLLGQLKLLTASVITASLMEAILLLEVYYKFLTSSGRYLIQDINDRDRTEQVVYSGKCFRIMLK